MIDFDDRVGIVLRGDGLLGGRAGGLLGEQRIVVNDELPDLGNERVFDQADDLTFVERDGPATEAVDLHRALRGADAGAFVAPLADTLMERADLSATAAVKAALEAWRAAFSAMSAAICSGVMCLCFPYVLVNCVGTLKVSRMMLSELVDYTVCSCQCVTTDYSVKSSASV